MEEIGLVLNENVKVFFLCSVTGIIRIKKFYLCLYFSNEEH